MANVNANVNVNYLSDDMLKYVMGYYCWHYFYGDTHTHTHAVSGMNSFDISALDTGVWENVFDMNYTLGAVETGRTEVGHLASREYCTVLNVKEKTENFKTKDVLLRMNFGGGFPTKMDGYTLNYLFEIPIARYEAKISVHRHLVFNETGYELSINNYIENDLLILSPEILDTRLIRKEDAAMHERVLRNLMAYIMSKYEVMSLRRNDPWLRMFRIPIEMEELGAEEIISNYSNDYFKQLRLNDWNYIKYGLVKPELEDRIWDRIMHSIADGNDKIQTEKGVINFYVIYSVICEKILKSFMNDKIINGIGIPDNMMVFNLGYQMAHVLRELELPNLKSHNDILTEYVNTGDLSEATRCAIDKDKLLVSILSYGLIYGEDDGRRTFENLCSSVFIDMNERRRYLYNNLYKLQFLLRHICGIIDEIEMAHGVVEIPWLKDFWDKGCLIHNFDFDFMADNELHFLYLSVLESYIGVTTRIIRIYPKEQPRLRTILIRLISKVIRTAFNFQKILFLKAIINSAKLNETLNIRIIIEHICEDVLVEEMRKTKDTPVLAALGVAKVGNDILDFLYHFGREFKMMHIIENSELTLERMRSLKQISRD